MRVIERLNVNGCSAHSALSTHAAVYHCKYRHELVGFIIFTLFHHSVSLFQSLSLSLCVYDSRSPRDGHPRPTMLITSSPTSPLAINSWAPLGGVTIEPQVILYIQEVLPMMKRPRLFSSFMSCILFTSILKGDYREETFISVHHQSIDG